MKQTVAVLIIQNGNYVLQHRDNKNTIADPDTYGTWGGSVEQEDVSLEAAAIRELTEETGLVIDAAQLINIGNEIRDARAPENAGQQINFNYFAVNVEEGVLINVYEGQEKIVLAIPYQHNDKVNCVAVSAIEKYERYRLT